MHLFAFGINHQTAPLAVRERVAFNTDVVEDALHDLINKGAAKEAAILSTCNRTEVYCNTHNAEHPIEWMAEYHRLTRTEIDPYLYILPREEAIQHSFRVASGLDSMVLGETQILGQMKTAIDRAKGAGTLGFLLHKLFDHTFEIAKRVRDQTQIGANQVSMAAAAVKLASRIFPSISDQKVLFIGAGEMIRLNAERFAAENPKKITVANRTFENAHALASRFHGDAITLIDLPDQIAQHDIIITCTASPLPILGKGLVERAIKQRKHRPLFIVDLAVPRDVEAEVKELDDVFLYTVDDIAGVVQDGIEARQNAVREAEVIINSGVTKFVHWMESREAVPTIRALRDHAERNRRHEVDKALRMLSKGEPAEKVLEMLSNGLTNKFLHAPTQALNLVHGSERENFINVIQRMYHLHPED